MTTDEIKEFLNAAITDDDFKIIAERRPRTDNPFLPWEGELKDLDFKKYEYRVPVKYAPFENDLEAKELIGAKLVDLSTDKYSTIMEVGKNGFRIKANGVGAYKEVNFVEAFHQFSLCVKSPTTRREVFVPLGKEIKP